MSLLLLFFKSEDKEGETQSTNMDHVSECKQEEADIALNEKQQLSEGKICKQFW